MDLEKHLVERDERLQRIFDLIHRLEPALEYDEHLADVSFESVSLTSKAGEAAARGSSLMSNGSKPGRGTPSRTSMASVTGGDEINLNLQSGSARRSSDGQSADEREKDRDRDASG